MIKLENVWYSSDFKKLVLPLMSKEEPCELKETKLKRRMWDFEIQKEISDIPISPNQLLYFLNNKIKDKTKWYLFHVQLNHGVVAVNVYWLGGEWYCNAVSLGYNYRWGSDYHFFSLATDSKKLNLETSDSLTLKEAIKICKENGLKVIKVIEE